MRAVIRAIGLALLMSIAVSGPAAAQLPPSTSFTGCSLDGADDKCEAWFTTFDDDEVSPTASETPADVAVAPDGNAIYTAMRVTVGSGFNGKSRWAIMAQERDGARKWLTYWGDLSKHNFATSITVAPNGRLVYVSGTWRDDQIAPDGHLTTIAFDARDGSIAWIANYDGPGNGTDNARDLMVSPDGRTLYIAGISAGVKGNSDLDYAAIAYDALTGEERWVTRWDGIGRNQTDTPFALDLSSSGEMLYLTGWSYGEGEFNNDYGTIAVATTGERAGEIVWTARYDGVGVRAPDQAEALVVSPDDRTVYVTGMSNDVDGGPPFNVNYGYATIAYDALTGQQLWESRRQWEGSNFDSPNAMTIDPGSNSLVITGQTGRGNLDYGTVAYDLATGQEKWSDRYGFQNYELELGREIAMDPRGDTVYVTGVSAKSPPGVPGLVLYAPNADQLTIAYDVTTGQKRWLARFNPNVTDFVSVQSMAISPDASMIYTAAGIDDQNWDNDADDLSSALIAYEIGAGIPIPDPPPVIEVSGDDSGQFSDDASVAARLTDGHGDPLAGREVTFELGSEKVTATTDAEGVASTTMPLRQAPGDYRLVVTYSADDGSARAESPFTIRHEDASLALEVDRHGRTLRGTLTDADSGAPVVGREILFYFKDQLLGQAVTDEHGTAELPESQAANRSPKHLRADFQGDDYFNAARSS